MRQPSTPWPSFLHIGLQCCHQPMKMAPPIIMPNAITVPAAHCKQHPSLKKGRNGSCPAIHALTLPTVASQCCQQERSQIYRKARERATGPQQLLVSCKAVRAQDQLGAAQASCSLLQPIRARRCRTPFNSPWLTTAPESPTQARLKSMKLAGIKGPGLGRRFAHNGHPAVPSFSMDLPLLLDCCACNG